MAIFNWGIYAGIGLAFPIGRYVTEMNVGGLVSKILFFFLIYYNTYKYIFTKIIRIHHVF